MRSLLSHPSRFDRTSGRQDTEGHNVPGVARVDVARVRVWAGHVLHAGRAVEHVRRAKRELQQAAARHHHRRPRAGHRRREADRREEEAAGAVVRLRSACMLSLPGARWCVALPVRRRLIWISLLS